MKQLSVTFALFAMVSSLAFGQGSPTPPGEGNGQIQQDREALKADREKLKADREKMRADRHAAMQARRGKQKEKQAEQGSGSPQSGGTE